jgi:hypothetical protein
MRLKEKVIKKRNVMETKSLKRIARSMRRQMINVLATI